MEGWTTERPAAARPPLWGAVTDVPGVLVGQVARRGDGWLTGVSVVVPPPGTVGAVDVRGGGPGTHETDALDPTTLVPTVDAVVLTGGSAYGLAAAGGVQAHVESLGRGFGVGPPERRDAVVVPIVPAAAVFDLGRGGDPAARPDREAGRLAAAAALRPGGSTDAPARGVAGAGTGALVAGGALKGGVGTACLLTAAGARVGALAVVNAVGSPVDPATGALLGAAFVPARLPRPPAPDGAAAVRVRDRLAQATAGRAPRPGTHTTLAVVVTDAALDPARTRRTATAAHAGLARALDPVHTLLDGDTVFALATGAVPVPDEALLELQAAAATAVMLAVMDGVLAATTTSVAGEPVPGLGDLLAPPAR